MKWRFGNSVVSRDVFLDAVLWEDVLLKQTRERVCGVLLEWMLERACDVWKEHKWNPINSERMLLCSSLTVQCFAGCSSFFTDLHWSSLRREKCIKEFLVVFWQLFATSMDLCRGIYQDVNQANYQLVPQKSNNSCNGMGRRHDPVSAPWLPHPGMIAHTKKQCIIPLKIV